MSSLNFRKHFVLWGTICIVLAWCYGIGYVIRNQTLPNVIFYVLLGVALATIWAFKLQVGLFHLIVAAIWAAATWAFLGGGILGKGIVIWYIALYIMRTKAISTPPKKKSSKQQQQPRKTGRISYYGRFAWTRIPMPWLKYTLDLDKGILTRDCLFPGPLDKDSVKKDFWGKDDDLVLKQVFDWDFSTKLYRRFAGVSCFEFQSKKIGKSGEKRVHWHNLPSKMVEPLREKLIELN